MPRKIGVVKPGKGGGRDKPKKTKPVGGGDTDVGGGGGTGVTGVASFHKGGFVFSPKSKRRVRTRKR